MLCRSAAAGWSLIALLPLGGSCSIIVGVPGPDGKLDQALSRELLLKVLASPEPAPAR